MCFLVANAVPTALTLDEIQLTTKQGKTLQSVPWLNQNEQWHKTRALPTEHQKADRSELKLFKQVKDKLSVNDESDVILRSSFVFIPGID